MISGWKTFHRRMSGEKKAETAVATDADVMAESAVDTNVDEASVSSAGHVTAQTIANENGGGFASENRYSALINDENNQEIEESECVDNCGECGKLFTSIKAKFSTNCFLCKGWFCVPCTKIQKNTTIVREDVFWACKPCLPKIADLTKKSNVPHVQGGQTTDDTLNVDGTPKTLEERVERVIRSVIPASMKECAKDMNDKMSKLWSSTLFGEGEFPTYDKDIATKRDLNGAIAQSEPKKKTGNLVKGLVKQGVYEYKRAEEAQEVRRRTVVIHRIPEPSDIEDSEERKESDKACVEEVFEALGLDNIAPKNISRLGEYKAPQAGQPSKARPIKLAFDRPEDAKRVIEGCPNLRGAPEHIKQIGIAYDSSREQRDTIRAMVAKAKEDNKNCPNGVWKVRGPPWQPYLKMFEKRE